MVTFRKITEENFVAANAVSLAQAWLYREDEDVFPFAIYHNETPVGFMLLEEDMEEELLILWRIMIAPEYEGRGFGTAAVELLIRYARDSGLYRALDLDFAPDNVHARHIYDKLGFQPTGVISHGSVEMRLSLF